MIGWWLLGGLIAAVIVVLLYRTRRTRRQSSLAAGPIMTKTADGEPLQFLVRATRRTRGRPR
ncbi:MAG TPA: hypothetical protein VN666_04875 [Nitrospira sp.]|nr:hypothetical protein [Nitrospira sp.]